MSIARRNLGARLLSGELLPRPGMYGIAPTREPVERGPMGSDEAVAQVAALVAGGMQFGAAWATVAAEMEVTRVEA